MTRKNNWVIERFSHLAHQRFGLRPLDDDCHLLTASIEFYKLWGNCKRLDQNDSWHQALITRLIDSKLNTIAHHYEQDNTSTSKSNDIKTITK